MFYFDCFQTPRNEPSIFGDMHGEVMRMVGLKKNPGEPLGLTVEQDDNGNLVVARILGGGAIDRQGLLHVGDIILEVNGEQVDTPEDLQLEISRAKDSVTLKIGPAANNQPLAALNSTQVKADSTQVRPGKKLTVRICFLGRLLALLAWHTGSAAWVRLFFYYLFFLNDHWLFLQVLDKYNIRHNIGRGQYIDIVKY